MNSASIRESIVSLCSVVRVVANRVSSSSCQSVRNANSVQRRYYSALRSFRSSQCCWCLVEAKGNHAIEIISRSSTMPGKGKKKGAKKQTRDQSQNMAPGTAKPGPDRSEAIDAAPESQSPRGGNQIEPVLAAESEESAAVSEMHRTEADKPKSPVFGGASALGKEQKTEETETTAGDNSLKLTTSEETTVKSDVEGEENLTLTTSTAESNVSASSTAESNVNAEVVEEEDKESDEALNQPQGRAVDHQDKQPSDKTEDDKMSDTGSKESNLNRSNNDMPKLGNPSFMGSAKHSETNKDSSIKTAPTPFSVQGHSPYKPYHGTRQSAIMQERGEITF